MMNTAYQKRTHTAADTTSLVWLIADNARDTHIHEFDSNREGKAGMKKCLDLRMDGYTKLGHTTLPTFNKNMRAMKAGLVFDSIEEEDELPLMDFSLESSEDNEVGQRNTLHRRLLIVGDRSQVYLQC
ncbi:hypothetical protein EDD85DRAFT_833818 [Armillaria nabsnona]|nr:hypothetical protein EDD85DRAFT_833818 [Armillaria nabsnona]